MPLICEEVALTGTTPIKLVASSALTNRQVYIFWSENDVKFGSSNDTDHGARLVQDGNSPFFTFGLPAGSELWAWGVSPLSSGYVSFMVSTTLLGGVALGL